MPARIVIQGGVSADTAVDLNTVRFQLSVLSNFKEIIFFSQVNIPSSYVGPYIILSNMKKHYPLIVIRIKRCQQVRNGCIYIKMDACTWKWMHMYRNG